jgi:tRNA nucleotidyltransferase (CCA-adding enzyme)
MDWNRVRVEAQAGGFVSSVALDIRLSEWCVMILGNLKATGARGLLVGGCVRDGGHDVKDIDIEVYGMTFDELQRHLSFYGKADIVGKSFGTIKFTDADGCDYDFALPRSESKTGVGHKDFEVTVDSEMSPRQASARRDFTINSMLYDPLTQELFDYHGGRRDLEAGVLRATSEAFQEDALRVLRGMQLACRFGLALDSDTARMCRDMKPGYAALAKERICEEWMKWATKSKHPGLLFPYLEQAGWIDFFPEVKALLGVPQEYTWHPEGDVGTHTMLVVDEAAVIADRDGLTGDDRAVLLFAALCHDFAKPETTERKEVRGEMRWTAHGHEKAGGPHAKAFLDRIGVKAEIAEKVVPLVENHLAHASFDEPNVARRVVRRLAERLYPASIEMLVRVMEADHSGRTPLPKGVPEEALRMLALAQDNSVEARPMMPLVLGRHVLPYYSGKPGVHIGVVTKAAKEAQTNGDFSTEEEARAWLSEYMSSPQ